MRQTHILSAVLVVSLLTAGATASVAGALVAGPGNGPASVTGTTTVTVTNVTDGDTVSVRYPNGSTDTVRLLGVDTPEVHAENTPGEFEGVPNTTAGKECLRSAGKNASAFTKQALDGETVTLKYDSNTDRRGYYGRLLAYVYVNGSNFDYRLVDSGHARVYDSNFSKNASFYAAEDDAQNATRGLWSCRTIDDGSSGGSDGSDGTTGGDPAIEWVYAEADSLNEERVEIRNTGSETLDLSGYTLADAAGHSYTFPDGFMLAADSSVWVHTGDGSGDSNDRYAGYEQEVWNDGGDTATLTAANGTVVAERAY
ncbi:lamin tail domain-containing protein [Halarchaeum sp. P4]|uniref:lamin tail domain-containing protein n=1 Tax=Halarchaeum sp. P4 TaxID=3421639 RepID=UPI003EBEEE9F